MSPRKQVELKELPPEIVIKFLNYLPAEDIVRNVSAVSKEMHLLTSDPSVRFSVKITNKTAVETIRGILKSRSNQVRSLSLDLVSDEALEVVTSHVAKCLSNVNKVYIEAMPPFEFSKEQMARLTGMKNVREIDLVGFLEDSCWSLTSEFQSLKRVDINLFFGSLTEDDFAELSKLRNVEILKLHFNNHTINFQPESIPFPEHSGNSGKTFNQFMAFKISNLTVAHFEMIVCNFPNVSTLHIYGGKLKIGNLEELSALKEVVKNGRNLSEICFHFSIFDKKDFIRAFSKWNVELVPYRMMFECKMKKT